MLLLLFTLLVFSIKSVCVKFQVGYPHKFWIGVCLRGPEVLTLFEDETNENWYLIVSVKTDQWFRIKKFSLYSRILKSLPNGNAKYIFLRIFKFSAGWRQRHSLWNCERRLQCRRYRKQTTRSRSPIFFLIHVYGYTTPDVLAISQFRIIYSF